MILADLMLRNIQLHALLFLVLLVTTPVAHGQANPHSVPLIDAEAGPCTAEMTVTDQAGKPVYGATIKVRIEYGFMKVRKTDLQAGTNVDGKAKFIGLPDKLNKNLHFRASSGDAQGSAFANPAKNCHSTHSIVL